MNITNRFVVAAISVVLGVAILSYFFVKLVLFVLFEMNDFDFSNIVDRSTIFFYCRTFGASFMGSLTVYVYYKYIDKYFLRKKKNV